MKKWSELTRRQQIWLIARQHERIADLVQRIGMGAFLMRTRTPKGTASPSRTAIAPLPPSTRILIEDGLGLERGFILPIHEVPDHDSLPTPMAGSLRIWERIPVKHRESKSYPRRAIIVKALKRLKALGATRQDLAVAANVSMPTITRPRNRLANSMMTAGTAMRIAYALDLPLENLIGRREFSEDILPPVLDDGGREETAPARKNEEPAITEPKDDLERNSNADNPGRPEPCVALWRMPDGTMHLRINVRMTKARSTSVIDAAGAGRMIPDPDADAATVQIDEEVTLKRALAALASLAEPTLYQRPRRV